jgi:hypothetical protein
MVAHSTDNCRFLWRSASKEATFVGDTSVTLPNGTASAAGPLSSPFLRLEASHREWCPCDCPHRVTL